MSNKRLIKWISGLLKFATIFAMLGLLLSYLCPYVHPKTLPFLPFFGLLYPVFLIINVLLMLVFAISRSRWSLIILVVILIGGKLHFRQFVYGTSYKTNNIEESFSVMSYNVRLFDLYNWSVDSSNINRRKIFDFLNQEQPDIACFQEFYHQDKSKTFPTRDSLIDFLHTVDFHERYSHRTKGRRNFGIAILSKFPMIAKGEVPLQISAHDNNDNYCIFADIVRNQDTFRIYNIHLQSIKLKTDGFAFIDETGKVNVDKSAVIENVIIKLGKAYPLRAEQAKLVLDHAHESPYPVIICGDFNDTPMSYTYHQFQKSYEDAFRTLSKGIGATYVGRIPAGRIDYIFSDRYYVSSDFVIQQETLSDHRAISCRFTKRNK